VLRLRPDGHARVTIPRGGSLSAARRFAEQNKSWLKEQWQRQAAQAVQSKAWPPGAEILFRGEMIKLETKPDGSIQFGAETIKATGPTTDLRPAIEKHLRNLAAKELPPRTFELSARHQLTIQRVMIRSQKSRWGSCSRSGTISLNWKLIQMPPFVRDYILLHELMHLREMNHSARFWREVARVCPDFLTAKQWLKQHSARLK
jgi:predicted metal-dependent hydrolase